MTYPSSPASSLAQLLIGAHPELLLDATHAVEKVTLNVTVSDPHLVPQAAPPHAAKRGYSGWPPGGMATATMQLEVTGDPLLLRQLTQAALEGTLLYVRYSPDGVSRGGRKLTGHCRVASVTAVSAVEAPLWVYDYDDDGSWRHNAFDLTFPEGLRFEWY